MISFIVHGVSHSNGAIASSKSSDSISSVSAIQITTSSSCLALASHASAANAANSADRASLDHDAIYDEDEDLANDHVISSYAFFT